jgi:uncharacterized membrane protein YcaP (DUF421 family)
VTDLIRGFEEFLGLGVEAFDLTLWQMLVRTVIIYVALIVLVRTGEKRFLGKHTALDIILAIVIGSVLSRAINSSAPLLNTIAAGAALIGMHWMFSAIAFSTRFGAIVKGSPRKLVSDGEIQWDAMRKSHLTENDLRQVLRLTASHDDLSRVQTAYLERSGDISIITRDDASGREPRVLDIRVEDGVQHIRIRLE